VITSEFHVTINGVNYRLAEDAEGEHYNHVKEALRPTNNQIIQGESTNKFNVRPDLLLWSWTDWAEGEGQIKFDSTQPGRSLILEGVNFFGRPGNLFLGYTATEVLNSAASAFTVQTGLVVAKGGLYAVGVGAGQDDYYAWDTGDNFSWQAGTSMALTDGAISEQAICGDAARFYFVKHGTDSVYHVVPAGAVTLLNDQTNAVASQLIELGDYLYKYDVSGYIYELSKTVVNTTTPETAIHDFSASGGCDAAHFIGNKIVAGDNRVYALAVQGETTIIFEIVPSSSAGTGFGRELTRIEGLVGESLWWHGGFLFWTGRDSEPDATQGPNRSIYYYQPGQSWGTLGEVRSFQPAQPITGSQIAAQAGRLHTSAFVGVGTYDGRTAAQAALSLFEVDAVRGSFGQSGRPLAALAAEQVPLDVVYWNGLYVTAYKDLATGAVFGQTVWDTSTYSTVSGVAISPEHDFDITTEKILHSIEIITEPLPASTTVTISYSLDGGSWTAITAFDTDNSVGGIVNISSSSATKSFRSMRLKVQLDGTSSATPVLKAVNVRASLDTRVNVWSLLLDCTDESSPRGYDGATLISNLTGIADNTVIAFVDGYANRGQLAADNSTYNVVIDGLSIQLTNPGEGFAHIVLRERF
jgi:hypothetical protein